MQEKSLNETDDKVLLQDNKEVADTGIVEDLEMIANPSDIIDAKPKREIPSS